jgi:hypothetical protein
LLKQSYRRVPFLSIELPYEMLRADPCHCFSAFLEPWQGNARNYDTVACRSPLGDGTWLFPSISSILSYILNN